jgi:hypothetical protein
MLDSDSMSYQHESEQLQKTGRAVLVKFPTFGCSPSSGLAGPFCRDFLVGNQLNRPLARAHAAERLVVGGNSSMISRAPARAHAQGGEADRAVISGSVSTSLRSIWSKSAEHLVNY